MTTVGNYLSCPKCGMKYHRNAVDCPKCKSTQQQHQKRKQTIGAAKNAIIAAKNEYVRAGREKPLYCTACGSTFIRAKLHTRGSLLIEIVAWCLFLLPGLIYSVWRLTTRSSVCPVCFCASIIPANSPTAKAHLNAGK